LAGAALYSLPHPRRPAIVGAGSLVK